MASLPFSGLNLQLDYVRALLRTATYAQDTSMLEWGNNLSLLSAMTKLVGKTYIEEIRLLNAIFSVAVLVYVGKQFRAPYNAARFTQEFAHATALVLLLVPVFEEHYLVLLFLPFLCLFAKLPDLGRYGQTAFLLAYLLVALRYSTVSFPPFRFGLPSLLANGKLYGLFIVVVTAFLLWKKSSTGLQKHV